MAEQHRPVVPIALEQVLDSLEELRTVLGAAARAAVPEVQTYLTRAMAARDRGDPVEALRLIGRAMTRLAALAERLDPGEAALMRAVAERFQAALLRGDLPEAKQDMDVMLERSGSRERKKV